MSEGSDDELGVPLPPIPPGGLLLHVGVHKSGTTSLQETLRRSSRVLSEVEVLYQGPTLANWGRIRSKVSDEEASEPSFRKFLGRVHAHQGRVVVSSEFLCAATPDQAGAWIRRLGNDRPVRVMVTIRSLADLLPSTWQETVKGPTKTYGGKPYEEWLANVLVKKGRNRQAFWTRNNYPGILERWGKAVGPENLIFVLTDKSQPERPLRVTEWLLDIPSNSLLLADRTNQSISYEEAELFRQIKLAAPEGLTTPQILGVRKEMRSAMHGSELQGHAIPVPKWAADEIRPIGARFAKELASSPATIVGDASVIAEPTVPVRESGSPPEQVPMTLAVAAVMGALRDIVPTSGMAEEASKEPSAPWRSRFRRVWGLAGGVERNARSKSNGPRPRS